MTEASNRRALQLLAGLVVVLIGFAVVLVTIGEHLLAGVTFLGIALIIYLRETW